MHLAPSLLLLLHFIKRAKYKTHLPFLLITPLTRAICALEKKGMQPFIKLSFKALCGKIIITIILSIYSNIFKNTLLS